MTDVEIPSLLIVGSKPGSIGEAVKIAAAGRVGRLTACGQDSEEDVYLDIRDDDKVRSLLEEVRPTHVVCTVGINYYEQESMHPSMQDWMRLMTSAFQVNCTGILGMARYWSQMMAVLQLNEGIPASGFHFAAISSNSADIARTGSSTYCASKAALSMGMRCLARDDAKAGMRTAHYVYEPGWVGGTPMSYAIAGNESERMQARYHRIPSGLAINAHELGMIIVDNLFRSWNVLNGSCIRLDGGEQ